MAEPINPQLLLFSEALLVWTFATYAVNADPLREEAKVFRSRKWKCFLGMRIAFAFGASLLLSHSCALSFLLAAIVAIQPLARYMLPSNRAAENECFFFALTLSGSCAIIRILNLSPVDAFHIPLKHEHKAVIYVSASMLFAAVRGGTYIVRGVLKKAGTLPRKKSEKDDGPVDEAEFNRGRLIGNIERITLAIIAAGGSYAALGFLVAAKGVVRFEEFEQNRDFTEYFLIGSLASVLIALCAGLVIRYALLMWWPELLSLQMR